MIYQVIGKSISCGYENTLNIQTFLIINNMNNEENITDVYVA